MRYRKDGDFNYQPADHCACWLWISFEHFRPPSWPASPRRAPRGVPRPPLMAAEIIAQAIGARPILTVAAFQSSI